MFDDPAVSVALSVELRAASEPVHVPEPPRRRLGEIMPVRLRSDAELCGELQRLQALESMLAAYKAELVVALARLRPPSWTCPRGHPVPGRRPGAPGRCGCRRCRSSSPTSSPRC